ncbi:MAG: hypothetical protein F6K53_22080 [Moorea sp. SIO4A1]|nr:hypothetical protein [Moorena sp. SIO4A1]NEO20414.1 hypothetical protein [Moorena sp. SIO4A5]NEQ59949.1 hypothetical protein [Moorena sp. SIO4A1]
MTKFRSLGAMQRCDPWRIKFANGKRTITVLGVSPTRYCIKTMSNL